MSIRKWLAGLVPFVRIVAVAASGLTIYSVGYGHGIAHVLGIDGWTQMRVAAEFMGNIGVAFAKAIAFLLMAILALDSLIAGGRLIRRWAGVSRSGSSSSADDTGAWRQQL